MPFDDFKIKLVDEEGRFLGYRCELCGFEVIIDNPRHAMTASSALTNHIKSRHPKEYEEKMGHPPIWRYSEWKFDYNKFAWKKKEES